METKLSEKITRTTKLMLKLKSVASKITRNISKYVHFYTST